MLILNLLVALVNSMAVVLVVTYLVTRTRWFDELLGGRSDRRTAARLSLCFGLLGIYGTMSGIIVLNAVANARYIGPLVAGLLGGPVPGLGAGLLAGLHRHFFGAAFASDPSVVSTVVAGLAGGLYQRFVLRRTGRPLGVAGAALFAFLLQVYHLGQILLWSKPFPKALKLVELIALPMVLANCVGTALFFYITDNLLQERRTREQRDSYLAQKQKIEGELAVARDIQMSLVPKMLPRPPHWPGCELYADLHSAREVGGDFYDFFLDPEGKLIFAIGDVSDKGVPAALFMAVTKTLIKGMCEPGQLPHELLAKVNREVSTGNDMSMFITLFCAKLDLATGELWYSNAGHNPPLVLRRDGAVDWLALPRGMVLGAFPGSRFRTEALRLEPGDTILAYTDGVTEAMDPEQALYSGERLLETVRPLAGTSPRALVEAVGDSVKAFANGALQSDDVTLLAVRYTGP